MAFSVEPLADQPTNINKTSKYMKLKSLAAIAFLLLITGCQQTPDSLVYSHLNLIKSGKLAEANKQYCTPTETLALHSVKSFTIPEPQPEIIGNFTIPEYTVTVESDQFIFKVNPDSSPTSEKAPIATTKIQVWKSEEFYQQSVKASAQLNRLINSANPLPVPERSSVNAAPECLRVVVDSLN